MNESDKNVFVDSKRSLRAIELQEQEFIRNELYTSLIEQCGEPTTDDTLHMAKEARRELLRAAFCPMREKMAAFRGFVNVLKKPEHERVVSVFILTSLVMFSAPVATLLVGMHLVAPAIGVDPGTCGGLISVGTTVAIMAWYVWHALCEDSGCTNSANTVKKRQ
ncbi:hypothetical protein ERJ75_001737300 [Trypanosoma vivax]|uniref:Uncharacterized protein n=1 Tax=Trypanosoma vivax (strain Y486) TaxID=1055687 RepID=F9WSL0_TRYVY|nr:hypothetical protein TRVL_08384 [Trypanosoma vivax]KAH8604305.1 hypothetical protein ERJ75_001737300 [Trypanosoma vivax]CCD20549.1 hypothetical protein, conserved [Trypanosoma vivax Y486]|eukprot:CCD20549.1 hypothetical protein, conserved [Trypanosoma vivax Y486]